MLEILVIALLLFGVPILVVMILAGAAAYVREGAERELEAMAAEEGIDLDDPDLPADPRGTDSDELRHENRPDRNERSSDSTSNSNSDI